MGTYDSLILKQSFVSHTIQQVLLMRFKMCLLVLDYCSNENNISIVGEHERFSYQVQWVTSNSAIFLHIIFHLCHILPLLGISPVFITLPKVSRVYEVQQAIFSWEILFCDLFYQAVEAEFPNNTTLCSPKLPDFNIVVIVARLNFNADKLVSLGDRWLSRDGKFLSLSRS